MKRFISWWCSLFGLKDQVLINLVTAIVAAAALMWRAGTVLSIVVGLGFRALIRSQGHEAVSSLVDRRRSGSPRAERFR
ncbi:hypothetical protein [Bosea sp. Root483D1]|uniref:hypothetical protein n=1 Tax=Bosea sp. Root483D1 TaxID=1736544 RepID=UPI0012E3CB71|nr:hypothetical protein [Bosea sp. Root483D1]